jgi:hypothetical protein
MGCCVHRWRAEHPVRLLDRLALDEDLGDRAQRLAVLGEQVLGPLVRGLDDAADQAER